MLKMGETTGWEAARQSSTSLIAIILYLWKTWFLLWHCKVNLATVTALLRHKKAL